MVNKQRKIKLLIFLLIFALALFAYARKEIFFQQAKKLIKYNLENNLPCKISIGKIKAGLFYGLVLEDLEISFPPIFSLALNIKVDQARIDYNLWQSVFTGRDQKQKDVGTLRLISPDINFAYQQARVENLSFNQIQPGRSQKFALGDFAFVLEGGQISFGNSQGLLQNLHGRVLLSQKNLYFQDIKATFNDELQNVFKFYGELSEKQLSLTANLEHLKIGNFDILTNLALTFNKRFDLEDKLPKISGSLKTYGSVLNSRPFPELSSSFEIQDAKLRIFSLGLGDSYDLRGIVSLSAPFTADLSLNFYQAELNQLIAQFSPAEEQLDFSGLVNGLIKITGDLTRPRVEGYLEAKHGHIGELDFINADIRLKGRYPIISIVDSRVRREEDFFIVEGAIDFTSLESQDFFDIRFKTDKGILWQGWDITRKAENQVRMSKGIADDLKITFDAFMKDESTSYRDNYPSELGVEYRIFGDKLLKLRFRKEEEILGVERRVKF